MYAHKRGQEPVQGAPALFAQRSAQALRALPPPDCVETIQGSVAYGNARHGVTAAHVTA